MNNLLGAIIALVSVFSASVAPLPTQPDPLTVALQSFLDEKGSPMPAVELVKYSNWPMIVAVSCAESGYGKYVAGENNAWGIKDFRAGSVNYRGYRDFTDWAESIKYTSELLYKYDAEDGSPEPKAMVRRWKYIAPFGGWLGTVNYSLHDIQDNVIAIVADTDNQPSS